MSLVERHSLLFPILFGSTLLSLCLSFVMFALLEQLLCFFVVFVSLDFEQFPLFVLQARLLNLPDQIELLVNFLPQVLLSLQRLVQLNFLNSVALLL